MSSDSIIQQPTFSTPCSINDAIAALSVSGIEDRGAIFTRKEVVEFILDLVGYTSDRPLYKARLLEPAFGEGDFLLPVIERLLKSWQDAANEENMLSRLSDSVRAVELHKDTFQATSDKVFALLRKHDVPAFTAQHLIDRWLVQGDFLLYDSTTQFDYVIGNPPYLRQEKVPNVLVSEYRRRFTTLYDRADLYIPFIEHSLNSLETGGVLGFICSDRWMKNKYGGPLREMVSRNYHLNIYVDMADTEAFHSNVVAYPAITVISREEGDKTRIAHKPEIDSLALSSLSEKFASEEVLASEDEVKEVVGITSGAEPWILDSSDQLSIMRRLEATFPLLEDTGCKVGIGVATGADKAFIGPFDELDVEPCRKLPLARTKDIVSGEINWRGDGIINPFHENGKLVDLDDYPRLKIYLEDRQSQIAGRHVAKKAPERWYRTIDRIYPELTGREKLLIPDIKGDAQVVYEAGELYPHHNLYYITARDWDLRALQTVLKSGIARLFVSIYSTKMRGGYLRFQAQYLRRIRVPHWKDVSEDLKHQLREAAIRGDTVMGEHAVSRLYNLNEDEHEILCLVR